MARLDYGRCCIAGRSRWPALLRVMWHGASKPVMSRPSRRGWPICFRLRMTANVKRALTKMMAERDWTAAGHGWQEGDDHCD